MNARNFGPLVSVDPHMQQIFDLLGAVARNSAPEALLGDSGSGRSTAARAIHDLSRTLGAFIEVPCRGLTAASLAEALRRARLGTLVLDGVDDLPSGLVETARRACWREEPVDVRILLIGGPCTPRALEIGMVTSTLFPPLAMRSRDILFLWERFGGPVLDASAHERLMAHPWPGNVRELRETAERSAELGHLDLA